MAWQRIFAIGDIHGCVHALDALLEAIVPRADDQVIVLGDFIDQGYETRMVIDCLIELGEICDLICLMGNHEEMLLAARRSEKARRYWEMCGGVQMLNSYRFGAGLDDIPDEHWQFVSNCRDYYETDDHIFVHANIDPDAPLAEQQTHTLRWELLDPETARRHISGKTVVAGHTEQKDGELLDLGFIQCIDTACWRHGWLTAIDVLNDRVWQASRFGQLRKSNEAPVGTIGQSS